ncbi:MAG TPA: rhodanese-like domain-containing protein [Verrucomicrobiae bacterium]|nr:rhodanese-like domain-containing protein [Verrucomicrobiae bacterium]
MKVLLLETGLVAMFGVALALAANELSPRGLTLSRNYSPGGAVTAVRTASSGLETNGQSIAQQLEKQLAAEGLQLASSNNAVELFKNSMKDPGLVIFVDARDDEHYQAGHIPGAFQLDHFHPERYLALTLPACQAAQKIVVYCKGGSCEDSEQTAIFLRDAGIPRDRLFVYAGGFDEWTASHLPVEPGERNGGAMEKSGTNTLGGGAR